MEWTIDRTGKPLREPIGLSAVPSTGLSVRNRISWGWGEHCHKYPEALRPVTVLVAEDEFLIRLDVAEELRRVGWKVIEVTNADDAIELLQSPVIVDLVLTDVNMPGSSNGLDLARFVVRERPSVKIAVMSAHLGRMPDNERLCDLFIAKPFLHSQLVDQLRPLVEEGKSSSDE